MKRIAAMLMFLLAPIAFAGQALLAYGSGEVNAETRLQHSFNANAGDFALLGFNNLDFNAANNLTRYQIKPRLTYEVAEFGVIQTQLVFQKEMFWNEVHVGSAIREVAFNANRYGIGADFDVLGIHSELNLYAFDNNTRSKRLEHFVSYRATEKWNLNNQYWYDMQAHAGFNQASVFYGFSNRVSAVLQINMVTGRANVTRVGLCWSF